MLYSCGLAFLLRSFRDLGPVLDFRRQTPRGLLNLLDVLAHFPELLLDFFMTFVGFVGLQT